MSASEMIQEPKGRTPTHPIVPPVSTTATTISLASAITGADQPKMGQYSALFVPKNSKTGGWEANPTKNIW